MLYGKAICVDSGAWAHRGEVDGLPRFGTDWSQPAGPERDLSVQLSGWMLLEAAASLER